MISTAACLASVRALLVAALCAPPQAPLAAPVENPSGSYLVWGDSKVEINQYGDLGRNWPTPELIWEQYERLGRKARANPLPPNTLRTLLLVLPRVEATAVREERGREVVVGHRSSEMTSEELRWVLEQWRRFEDMVYVYSGGNAWLRTDVKVIDEPLQVRTDEDWGFWAGQQRELIERYIPFERGDYQSYNAIYCSKDLNAGPHGGTVGAIGGILGCGTSDTAFYGESYKPNRTGYVALHEWLNQQCSATSNMMPYPDGETLWNNYVLERVGYREDTELDDWPWLSMRRDTMTQIIRPGMWRRWTAIDPYVSTAIGSWLAFGPTEAGRARELSGVPDDQGRPVEMELGRTTHFDLARARWAGGDRPELATGTWYLRTYVASQREQEVRLWTAADERFEVWLDGVLLRDGHGWNYDDDGHLIEKVAYPTLRAGVSTVVLVIPDSDGKVEFRARFCDTDGSGRQPDGVTTFPRLEGREPLPPLEPVVHDFTRPRLHSWAEIADQPWTLLPRLDEAELRELTGIGALTIRTEGLPRLDADGVEYLPPQHLFLDVPADAVASPRIAEPLEDTARLDNDLDFNWESLAWLRVPGLPGPARDVLLVRFDVAEPVLALIRTRGRPATESLVGWVLVDHKLAYVALVDLDIDVDDPPATALGLLAGGR